MFDLCYNRILILTEVMISHPKTTCMEFVCVIIWRTDFFLMIQMNIDILNEFYTASIYVVPVYILIIMRCSRKSYNRIAICINNSIL